jgi:hypothetical protein
MLCAIFAHTISNEKIDRHRFLEQYWRLSSLDKKTCIFAHKQIAFAPMLGNNVVYNIGACYCQQEHREYYYITDTYSQLLLARR